MSQTGCLIVIKKARQKFLLQSCLGRAFNMGDGRESYACVFISEHRTACSPSISHLSNLSSPLFAPSGLENMFGKKIYGDNYGMY